jgi:hypothetical protein
MQIEYSAAKLNVPYYLDQSGQGFAKFFIKERKSDHVKIQYTITKSGVPAHDTITPAEWVLFGVYFASVELSTYAEIEDWFIPKLYPHKQRPALTRFIESVKKSVLRPEKQYEQLFRRLNDER